MPTRFGFGYLGGEGTISTTWIVGTSGGFRALTIHMRAVYVAVTGLTTHPATAKPVARVKTTGRFLRHDDVPRPELVASMAE
jgi:hypothetical protein